MSDCRSRGRGFDPGSVTYFHGDWSWNNFYGHAPPFRWIIQKRLLSFTSESMCMKYWLTACSSFSRKSVFRVTDCPAMTIADDMGRKASKQIRKGPFSIYEPAHEILVLMTFWVMKAMYSDPVQTCTRQNLYCWYAQSMDIDEEWPKFRHLALLVSMGV